MAFWYTSAAGYSLYPICWGGGRLLHGTACESGQNWEKKTRTDALWREKISKRKWQKKCQRKKGKKRMGLGVKPLLWLDDFLFCLFHYYFLPPLSIVCTHTCVCIYLFLLLIFLCRSIYGHCTLHSHWNRPHRQKGLAEVQKNLGYPLLVK